MLIRLRKFEYWHDSEHFWSLGYLKQREFIEVEYVEMNEEQNIDPSKILNYPLAADDLYAVQQNAMGETDLQAEVVIKAL